MTNLQDNGYIIQKKPVSDYCGVDGENWYLNYLSDKTYFEEFYDENIDKAWADSNYVDCCSDVEYIRFYIEESKRLGIECKVLLFDSYEEAEAFQLFREKIKRTNLSYEFEEGDFIIYKITEVCF